jgi:hypothetical protein
MTSTLFFPYLSIVCVFLSTIRGQFHQLQQKTLNYLNLNSPQSHEKVNYRSSVSDISLTSNLSFDEFLTTPDGSRSLISPPSSN